MLDEAQLGLLLLGLPVGNLIANPISVFIISRWGAVHTSLISIILMGIMFVAMNTCASDLEKESGVRLMSASHGMWSLGAMTGSLISGFGVVIFNLISLSWLDAHFLYVGSIAILSFLVTLAIRKDLWQIHEDWEKNKQPPVFV